MAALHRFIAILLADLRERTRSTRFLVVLVGMMITAWWCVPPTDASYMILSLSGGFRGSYSSAWVGMVLAMAFTLLLNLGGFYVVRGTLVRDIETRVWQLLVATPMTRGAYLLAKWTSHMAIFGVIILACLCVGLIAQWVRAEDRAIDLLELVKPVLLLSIPGLAVTAMAAIWFDLLPWLRQTAGNVLFFFLWLASLVAGVSTLDTPGSAMRTSWVSDPGGLAMVARDFNRVREAQTGKPQGFGFSIGSPRPKAGPERFQWNSWSVRPVDLAGRAVWLVFALGGVLLAAPLLDKCAARTNGAGEASARAGMRLRWLDLLLWPFARGRFGTLAAAEMKLTLRGRRWWWWLATMAAWGMQAFGTAEAMRMGMLLAWLLPLDVIANTVLREQTHRTGALVFTAAGIVRRLLAVRFVTGTVLLVALTLPGLVRLSATHPIGALCALTISVSIVSWGIAMGAICRNPRPFELLLIAALYLGSQAAALFDLGPGAATTMAWHGAGVLLAGLTAAWAWPRLARV